MNALVSTLAKNGLEEIRVHVKELKGRDLVDIRVYTALKEGDDKIPTGKGLSIEVANFPELKRAVLETENLLRENNLLNE